MLPMSELEVTRYRGLQGLSLGDLGRVNLLVGPNNSGKTSLLEAIALAAAPLDPWTWLRVANRRAPITGWPPRSIAESLRWLFPQRASEGPDTSYDGSIKLAISGESPIRAMEARYEGLRGAIEAAPRSPTAEGELRLPRGERRGAKIDVEVMLSADAPESGADRAARRSFTWWAGERFEAPQENPPGLRAQTITPYAHWLGQHASLYSQLRVEGKGEDVAELLSLVDPRIVGLEVLAARSEIEAEEAPAELYLRDRHAGLLPIDAFGDGMRRILLMALGVTRARGGVLLIDEIETAIHVSALGHVFRWIVRACTDHDVQLFATTHSLEAIDAILAADTTPEEDIVGYRLEAQGSRVLTHRYSEALLKQIRTELGADVR